MWRSPRRAVALPRGRERVERRARRPVADRVDVHLPAGRVERRDRPVEHGLGEVGRPGLLAGDPAAVGRRHQVGLEHRRGLGRVLDDAVEEELRGAHGHVRPRVRRAHAVEAGEHRVRVLGLLRHDGDRCRGTHEQAAGVAQRGHRGELRLEGGGVHVGGDAERTSSSWAARSEAASCSAECAGISCSSSAMAVSCRIPVGSPAASRRMTPPGGSGGAGRDAGELERAGVRHRDVPVERDDEQRPLRGQRVEVGPRGLLGHRRRVPEVDGHPVVARPVGLAGDQAPQRVEEGRLVEPQVVERRPPEHDAARERVQVRVVDARHEHPPAEVDDLGPRADQRPHVGDGSRPRRPGRRGRRRPPRPAPPWSRPGRLPGRCPRRSCADCNGAARRSARIAGVDSVDVLDLDR